MHLLEFSSEPGLSRGWWNLARNSRNYSIFFKLGFLLCWKAWLFNGCSDDLEVFVTTIVKSFSHWPNTRECTYPVCVCFNSSTAHLSAQPFMSTSVSIELSLYWWNCVSTLEFFSRVALLIDWQCLISLPVFWPHASGHWPPMYSLNPSSVLDIWLFYEWSRLGSADEIQNLPREIFYSVSLPFT